ncbi:hypothetical protein [Cupriavidus nantongensis]|uniref:Uncharacterized protein n=1 Tax=Cupriavidus nantongensis TaxID=1796606 RepID=A0A142JGR6_9BURK|nr:hypothetical protein [Cupriavidus nantongensis]AMR77278.1 hypothetical protein A2G96_05770 [Cupriavidus nantongensis]
MENQPQKQYAIIELFGHARIAGQISEQTFGGTTFVRIDVPEITYCVSGQKGDERAVIPAHTVTFGPGSIYAINWCDEAASVLAAHSIRREPLYLYALQDALRRMPEQSRAPILEGIDSDDIPY